MPKSSQPLFLARRSYRRRRMMDAARLLPVAGAVILMLPVLWAPGETEAPDTGRGTVYLFASWALLIAAAALIARGLGPALDEDDAAEGTNDLAALLYEPPRPPADDRAEG